MGLTALHPPCPPPPFPLKIHHPYLRTPPPDRTKERKVYPKDRMRNSKEEGDIVEEATAERAATEAEEKEPNPLRTASLPPPLWRIIIIGLLAD